MESLRLGVVVPLPGGFIGDDDFTGDGGADDDPLFAARAVAAYADDGAWCFLSLSCLFFDPFFGDPGNCCWEAPSWNRPGVGGVCT